MKMNDVKGMSKTELVKKQKTLAKDIFDMKMKNSLGQLSNPLEIRSLRKDLARIKTAISQQRSV